MTRTGAIVAVCVAGLLGLCASRAAARGLGEDYEFSAAMGGHVAGGFPGVFAEFPILDSSMLDHSVVVGFGLGAGPTDDYYGYEDEDEEYSERFRVSYRQYFGQPEDAGRRIARAFWHAGLSVGETQSGYYDPSTPPYSFSESSGGGHLLVGAGVRLRLNPQYRQLMLDLSLDILTGTESPQVSVMVGWTFGNAGGMRARYSEPPAFTEEARRKAREDKRRRLVEEARSEAEALRRALEETKARRRAREEEEKKTAEEELRRIQEAEARRQAEEEAARRAAEELRRRLAEERKKRESVPALVKTLKEGDSYQRCWAAEVLGGKGAEAKAAVPALVKALGDADRTVRRSAAAALGRLGPAAKQAVPALAKLLEDTNFDVRKSAAEAMAAVGADALPALVKALVDANRNVRWCAAYALGEMGPAAGKAVPALTKALEDTDRHVRRCVAEALGKIRERE